jgi:acyl dehydratase
LSDVSAVPADHVWRSKPVRARLWRLLFYALASGDRNRVHINPLTAWLYKSNLGGLTYCADLVLAITKAGFHRIITFKEQLSETIAREYEAVKFKAPVRVGMLIYYTFALEDREVSERSAVCTWKFKVYEYGSDKLLYFGTWISVYKEVELSKRGVVASEAWQLTKMASIMAICCALWGGTILALFTWLLHQPMSDLNFPIAP